MGLLHRPDLISPFLYSGSVLNLGLLMGAFAAALLGREFAIRVAPLGELLKGGIGGLLMGLGANLAFGCNIGGFFSAVAALSMSGIAMMLGRGIGSYLGLKYLLMLLALPFLYSRLGYARQAGFLLFGVASGMLFQRSRFCLVRAFREPFMAGEGDHTRAAALALTLSMIGFAILKAMDLKDATDWVFAGFWIGGLVGGVLFGIGMVLAGGCGAGSIWRAGEGHVKLWVAVVFFAVGGSLARLILVQTQLLQKLGTAVFLPNLVGWQWAMLLVVALMVSWYVFATWNERSRKFSLT